MSDKSSTVDEIDGDPAPTSRLRRMVECGVFVALYVALGYALQLDANAYLVMGIPLTLLFQRFVARKPIRAMWVRAAPPPGFDRWGVLLAVALAAYPAYLLFTALRDGAPWSLVLLLTAAAGGAVAAAYAIRHARSDTPKWLAWCMFTAGGIAVLLMVGGAMGPLAIRSLGESLKIGGTSFLLYLPIVFAIEEVTFRGALDSHVNLPGEGRGIGSAVYVSAIWGLWHLPMAEPAPILETVGQLLLLHIPVGLFLSIYWRRSGNLLVPGVTHAFMDSVRNAISSVII